MAATIRSTSPQHPTDVVGEWPDAGAAGVDRLDFGLVRVNALTTGVDFHVPFGGEKASSAGPREQGRAAREFYTTTATITIAPAARTP